MNSPVEKLNYGQKCSMQGLVKLCEAQNYAKPNPYAVGKTVGMVAETVKTA